MDVYTKTEACTQIDSIHFNTDSIHFQGIYSIQGGFNGPWGYPKVAGWYFFMENPLEMDDVSRAHWCLRRWRVATVRRSASNEAAVR